MPGQQISIPWGNQSISLDIPDRWQLNGILEPASLPPVVDPTAEVERALMNPIDSQGLEDLLEPGKRIVLVMDDGSRPTPVRLIIPILLAHLERCGITREQITLVPAIGLHRPMEAQEIEERAGVNGLAYENPECDTTDKLSFLGTTSRGTPVWINKTVAEAGLVISIGCIEPHIIASFGGGYKNIVPGVAGRVTTAHNHSLNCAPATFNMVGQPIENNPMRQDLEEAAAMLKGKVFVINAILNYCQEVVRIVAGNPRAAHRTGAASSAALYGVKISQPADVVITASHPMDSDLRQGVKALANTIRAVKPGGVVITFVKANEGVGVFGLANRKLPLGKGALKSLAPLLVRLVPHLKLKGMGEEDRFFLYFALQAMRLATMLMYAPTIPEQVKANLPFVDFVSSPEDALAYAQRKYPGTASVLVFPHGGITYPQIAM